MAHHARVEELSDTSSDSDPEIADISTLAPSRSQNSTLLAPSSIPTTAAAAQRSAAPAAPQFDTAKTKRWICLYPVYFDLSRTRAEGRRVGKSLAVPNPLARALADAVASLQIRCILEPGKMHPQDWGNVGRVKVELRDESGHLLGGGKVKNKHHLYILVAQYLQSHPTAPEDPLQLPIRGMPTPTEALPPPAVPRGWKINSILPLHSPAVTGGGVSENFLKDMMAEMGGGAGGAGMPGLPAGMGQLAGLMGGGPEEKETRAVKREREKAKGKKK